ncbi:MAG TPA: chemotaxis protein CheD [Vicinamibacterales bacterium]|nr:chemotaxis protein CheD [Vicinamibacterales bacterium]
MSPVLPAPASRDTWRQGTPTAASRSLVVTIGDFAVSNHATDTIVTHALGSCIAVCLWDGVAGVGGILHFLLPESRINPARAVAQPATFADTGIPLLFETAARLGLRKNRATAKLVGGADSGLTGGGTFDVGKRNILAARSLLWKEGQLVGAESVGGTTARTVRLMVGDGRLIVSSGRDVLVEL